MGKNKRKNVPGLQDLLDRPICYYCDKDFEDTNYLIDHQKAKHFRCLRCNRRLNTAGGLGVHMSQVHKEKLERVENALEDREDPGLEIFGMIGYPEKMLEAHKLRVTNEYFRREAEHRARTGNPPAGSQTGAENKKKLESTEDMKKRLAEFKAKKAAEKAAATNGSSSEANTPDVKTEPADQTHAVKQEPEVNQVPIPRHLDRANLDLGDAAIGVLRGLDAHPYPPPSAVTDHQSTFTPSPMYATSTMSTQPMYQTSATSHHMSQKPMLSTPTPTNAIWSFGPPKQEQQYTSTPGGTPGVGIGASGSPPLSSGGRQNSLPSAPGLPQRPNFDSPNISKEDMAKMHISPPAPPPGLPPQQYYNAGQMPPGPYGAPGPQYGVANPPYGTSYPPNGPPPPAWGMSQSPSGMAGGPWHPPHHAQPAPQPPTSYIGDQVDQLIQSVTGERPPSRSPPQPLLPRREKQPPRRSDYNAEGWMIDLNSEPVHPDDLPPGPRHVMRDPSTPPPPPPTPPPAPESPNTIQNSKIPFAEKSLENSILDPSQETASQQLKNNAPSVTTPSQKNTSHSGKHKEKDNVKLRWSNNLLSPEEKRAQHYYRTSPTLMSRKTQTQTIVDQTGEDGQEVTGAVDDANEP